MKDDQKTARVVVSIFIELSTLDTFEVFTSDIGSWWQALPQNTFRVGRKGVMQFKPGVGGALQEVYPDSSLAPYEVGLISVWEPGRKLVFGFRGGNFTGNEITEVEVRFEADEGGTRLTLEHRGWDVIRSDHPVRHGLSEAAFWQMLGGWWGDLLRDARSYSRVHADQLNKKESKEK